MIGKLTRGFSSPGDLHLSPVSAVVQLRPQLHHLDASEDVSSKGRGARTKKELDEDAAPRSAETEARAIDVKVKSAEGGEALVPGNLDLLKRMQDEQWERYDWVDADVRYVPFCRPKKRLANIVNRLEKRGTNTRAI